jgi:hypothetical protein
MLLKKRITYFQHIDIVHIIRFCMFILVKKKLYLFKLNIIKNKNIVCGFY